jgi:choline dehydrogenase
MGGRMGVTVATMLLTPASRGRVFLSDAAPEAKPVIVLRLLSAPEDVERMRHGTRLLWSIMRSSPLADLLERVIIWTDRMVNDDALLNGALQKFVTPMWHPAGTARMGPPSDNMSVVDQHCRVHQVAGMRVVDASVMPSIPSSPMNLSCMMLGERVAEWIA